MEFKIFAKMANPDALCINPNTYLIGNTEESFQDDISRTESKRCDHIQQIEENCEVFQCGQVNLGEVRMKNIGII